MTHLDALSLADADLVDTGTDLATPGNTQLGERLFAESEEPMIIIEVASQTILEVNPPAAALLQTTTRSLIGERLSSAFETASTDLIEACITTAAVVGSARTASVRTRQGGTDLRARLSLFRAGAAAYLLVRIDSNDSGTAARVPGGANSAVCRTLDAAEFGFLMTDINLRIDYANPSFAAMVERTRQPSILGSALTEWLVLTAANLASMRTQLAQRQAVIRLATRRCKLGRRAAASWAIRCGVAPPSPAL